MIRVCRLILMSVFLVALSVPGTTAIASGTDDAALHVSAPHVVASDAIGVGLSLVDCPDQSEAGHHANKIHWCGSSASILAGQPAAEPRRADGEAIHVLSTQSLKGLYLDRLKRPPRRS